MPALNIESDPWSYDVKAFFAPPSTAARYGDSARLLSRQVHTAASSLQKRSLSMAQSGGRLIARVQLHTPLAKRDSLGGDGSYVNIPTWKIIVYSLIPLIVITMLLVYFLGIRKYRARVKREAAEERFDALDYDDDEPLDGTWAAAAAARNSGAKAGTASSGAHAQPHTSRNNSAYGNGAFNSSTTHFASQGAAPDGFAHPNLPYRPGAGMGSARDSSSTIGKDATAYASSRPLKADTSSYQLGDWRGAINDVPVVKDGDTRFIQAPKSDDAFLLNAAQQAARTHGSGAGAGNGRVGDRDRDYAPTNVNTGAAAGGAGAGGVYGRQSSNMRLSHSSATTLPPYSATANATANASTPGSGANAAAGAGAAGGESGWGFEDPKISEPGRAHSPTNRQRRS